MGKTCKVVVCGQAAVGKTAILEQLINGDHVVGSVRYRLMQWLKYCLDGTLGLGSVSAFRRGLFLSVLKNNVNTVQ